MNFGRIRTPKGLVLIPVLLALVFIVACGAAATATSAPATSAPATATPRPTEEPSVQDVGIRGGFIPTHAHGSPATWFAYPCASLTCLQAFAPLYNQLIEYDPETTDPTDLRGDLATTWDVSSDGLTYTFHLDGNAKWWDGQPVTAEDVVFSLDLMTDPDEPRPRAGRLKNYYASSRAIDAKTVEVTIKFAAAAFLPYLGLDVMKIFPKHHLETGVDMKQWENQLGSGPFKLVKYDKDISYEYIRNDDYFKEGRPYWDGMEAFIITDSGTVIGAYKTKQVLMGGSLTNNLNNAEALQLGKDTEGQGTVHFGGPVGVFVLQINSKVAPFDNVKVREAINLAIHRQPLITLLSAGVDTLGSPFPPGMWFSVNKDELAELPGYRELNGEKHPDDIARARELLAEAGFPDGFETTVTARTVVEFVDIAQILVDQLDRFLNIKANVRAMESGAGNAAYKSGDWELAANGTGMMITDPDALFSSLYTTDASRNYSKWDNPRINEIFDLQTREQDQDKRRELVLEAGDILMVDSPAVGLYWSLRNWYVDNRIQNFNVPSTPHNQLKFEHLWCDPAC